MTIWVSPTNLRSVSLTCRDTDVEARIHQAQLLVDEFINALLRARALTAPHFPFRNSLVMFIQPKLYRSQDYINWPAPGSEDTELGVLMELEVGHGETEVYARVQA
jgi:hypothetical protein